MQLLLTYAAVFSRSLSSCGRTGYGPASQHFGDFSNPSLYYAADACFPFGLSGSRPAVSQFPEFAVLQSDIRARFAERRAVR